MKRRLYFEGSHDRLTAFFEQLVDEGEVEVDGGWTILLNDLELDDDSAVGVYIVEDAS